MPMRLLDLIHVVHEQQLGRDVAYTGCVPTLLIVQLDCKVP